MFILHFLRSLEGRPGRLLCSLERGRRPPVRSGPILQAAGGCLLSSPSTWPQLGASVAAAVELRRERTGPNQLAPAWTMLGSRRRWVGCVQEVRSQLKGTVGVEV